MNKQLPEGWKMVKLGEVTKVVSGATPKSEVAEYWDGDIVWITPADLSNLDSIEIGSSRRGISEAGYKSCSTELLPERTVLLSSRAPIGHLAISTTRLCTNQGFKSLVPSDKVDPYYLYFAMLHAKDRMIALGSGATFKEVSKSVVERFEIPLPPMGTQLKMAEVLKDAYALRKLRKQADDKMKELIPALFDEMFGDPVNNPKGWEVKKLENITTTIKNGLFKRPHEFGRGAPLVNVVDLFSGYTVNLENLNRVSATAEEIEKYRVEDGDLFFCRSSLKKEGIAKCAVIDGVKEPTVFECHTIMARIDKKSVNPKWLGIQLNHPGVRSYIVNRSQTSTMTTVGQKDILAQRYISPPRELQDIFVSKVDEVGAVIKKQSCTVSSLNDLFNSLMDRCMNGEIY